MLDLIIYWFTAGIGLTVGLLTAAIAVGLLVTLFIIISMVLVKHYYDKYHKGKE